MTPEEKYAQKLKRINETIALTEPDMVPLIPIVQCFPYLQAGYTMADILYDTEVKKARESIFKYLNDYDPDALMGHSYVIPRPCAGPECPATSSTKTRSISSSSSRSWRRASSRGFSPTGADGP